MLEREHASALTKHMGTQRIVSASITKQKEDDASHQTFHKPKTRERDRETSTISANKKHIEQQPKRLTTSFRKLSKPNGTQ
jgi:hypothetical protein